jgi:hypothetical protein
MQLLHKHAAAACGIGPVLQCMGLSSVLHMLSAGIARAFLPHYIQEGLGFAQACSGHSCRCLCYIILPLSQKSGALALTAVAVVHLLGRPVTGV